MLPKKEKQLDYDEIIIEIHHRLMSGTEFVRGYGWIPFEEFKKMPMITILTLYDKIVKEHDEAVKAYNKAKNKTKR